MIKIKLDKNKRNEPIFRIGVKEADLEKYKFIKRAILEGKYLKGTYNYILPLRFFEPIFRNVDSRDIILDKKSILFYLEFSDDYDDVYYYKTEADAKFMKRWREEGCPDIYKVTINNEDKKIDKQIAFKRINRGIT